MFTSVSSNVKAKDRTLKSIGVEDGGGGGARALQTKKSGKIFFSGNYHVKFGHFVNFHTYVFGQKCLAPKVV